jgi:hypothetical protein
MAIKKWINIGVQIKVKRPHGYSAEERIKVKKLFWPYLKLDIEVELKANKKAVLNKLHLQNQVWFKSIYIPKEC